MGSWRLKRQVDCGDEVVYKFTPKFVLKAGQSVTVRTLMSVSVWPLHPPSIPVDIQYIYVYNLFVAELPYLLVRAGVVC